jgi:hypothetical protein
MGTNYYRIPTESEMEERRDRLRTRLIGLKMTPDLIADRFRYIDGGLDDEVFGGITPWDEFLSDTRVHLGKRSMGWKFCWNFHDNKYYSNKQQLIDFIRSGRIVDEYGAEESPQEFLDMAFNWGEPDGLTVDTEYYKNNERSSLFNDPKYYDKEIDGLRVSSSTDFS